MIRSLVVSLALAAVMAAPVSAQEEPDLDGLLDTLATLWARGDAARLAEFSADSGLELEVHGETLGVLAGRRVTAALRRVFANQETVSVVASMTSRVTGAEDRAFGELRWELRPDGTTLPEHNTVFVGLVREHDGWKVSQIRILK